MRFQIVAWQAKAPTLAVLSNEVATRPQGLMTDKG